MPFGGKSDHSFPAYDEVIYLSYRDLDEFRGAFRKELHMSTKIMKMRKAHSGSPQNMTLSDLYLREIKKAIECTEITGIQHIGY